MCVALVFLFMVVASCVWLLFINPDAVLAVSLDAATSGLQLAFTLAAIYIFWMAVVEIAVQSGLIDKLAKKLRPFIRFLFGEQSEEVNSLIATNISANLIGASGAATPAAISAIEKMSAPEQTKANFPMIMLFILAATSLQVLPTTVIGILKKHGAVSPESIILPTIITSALATILGVVLVRMMVKVKK
jgi:spore maturation protein A